MQILTFIGFTLIVAIISYLKSRKTDENSSDGYFLAGRTSTAVVIAGLLLPTYLSTEQIVGLNGSAYASGLCIFCVMKLTKNKKTTLKKSGFLWYLQESNQGHKDFQSFALPTELRYHYLSGCKYSTPFLYLPNKFVKNLLYFWSPFK